MKQITTDEFVNEITAIEVLREDVMKKAVESQDPDLLMKANEYISGRVPVKGMSNPKSMLTDPMDFNSLFKYKHKPMRLSYEMLRRMAATPIVSSIITTRLGQMARFTDYAESKFDVGYQVVMTKRNEKPKKEDLNNIEKLTETVANCGFGGYVFGRDDFGDFLKKIGRDSLQFDQFTFEVLEDRKGVPREWFATDAATYRIAIVDEKEEREDKDKIQFYNGLPYKPSYVQLDRNNDINDYFYPWELCFGIRNPRTDLNQNGYGYSELEDMIDTITGMLWADEYNRRFFSHGSAPKGIIKVQGMVPEEKLKEFKREWMNQMAGVYNSWKTPIMHADKMEWVNLQMSNREMEYKSWLEYNIKIACAKFNISPGEIGFDLRGSSDYNPMLDSGKDAELKYSFDKGLTPLMIHFQNKFNKQVMWRIDPRYSLKFFGISSDGRKNALDIAVQELGNFKTLDEVRAEMDLKPMGKDKGGELIFNGIYFQWLNQKNQQEQEEKQNAMQQQQQEQGQSQYGDEGDDEQYGDEGEQQQGQEDENPFVKAFNDYCEKNLFNKK